MTNHNTDYENAEFLSVSEFCAQFDPPLRHNTVLNWIKSEAVASMNASFLGVKYMIPRSEVERVKRIRAARRQAALEQAGR